MVSIIVVNYYTDNYVERIEVACAQNNHVELIIVDNSTTFCGLGFARIIREGNIGYGSAINRGVTLSKFDNILVLNPDILLNSLTLKRVVELCENKTYKCVTFGLLNLDLSVQYGHSRLLNRTDTILTSCGLSKLFNIELKRYLNLFDKMVIEQPLGGCFLIKKDIFLSVSGFCENFFVFWEDVDFFWRLRDKGISPILINDIKIVHSGGGSFEKSVEWNKQLLELQGRIIYFKERGWIRPHIAFRFVELIAWLIKMKFNLRGGRFRNYFLSLFKWSINV